MNSVKSHERYSTINEDEFDSVLEPFIARFDFAGEHPALRQKQKLSIIIELLSFHRHHNGRAKHTPTIDGPNPTPPEILDQMLLSRIKSEAAETDPAILFQIDEFGRCPLHYAAEHGLGDVVSAIRDLRSVSPDLLPSLDSRLENDAYHSSPLLLAICSRNKNAVDEMLLLIREKRLLTINNYKTLPPSCARAALEMGRLPILESILHFGTSVNEMDELGQLLLCTAISCMPDACQTLLEHGAKTNVIEQLSGRPALCLACMLGDINLVKLLCEYGASHLIADSRGWYPVEHAAYRGHLEVMSLLASWTGLGSKNRYPFVTAPLVQTDCTKSSPIPWIQHAPTVNQGYYVWIRLGNNNSTNPVQALQYAGIPRTNDRSRYTDELLYSISVSVSDNPHISTEWKLPILESTVNKPWRFETSNIDDVKLVWQLYQYSKGSIVEKELIATGISLMHILSKGFRQNRESVVRDTTIPIISTFSSSYAGSITYSYFWSKPHPPPERLRKPSYWEFGNGIGGHRGSGKNAIDDKKLQIGENTAQSFSTAISAGAAFLEFDVQLTKDLVPVVYHDFLISETGTDSTVQTVTYDQFKTISAVQGPRRSPKSRSNSLQSTDYQHLETFKDRMDQTHFNKVNGFKANTRGNFIHERTCSLEELFRHVSSSVPLNIELKYPMLFEIEDWDMEPLAIQTDIFVDTILDKVYEHAVGRSIVFSSFSPEICIALSTKQRTFPVFFLSKTTAPKGEIRSCCLQQAIHFAKTWGLPGIVAECTPFIYCPRLIGYIKSAGLTVTSFGVGNSDQENVKASFHAVLSYNNCY